MRRAIIAYVDGSAFKYWGGAAAVLLYGDRVVKVRKGFVPGSLGATGETPDVYSVPTNQQMEIMAAILALRKIKTNRPRKVIIRSDSAYVVNCFRDGWIPNWRERGWKNSGGKPVANRALWETLDAWVAIHDVTFEKVKGHSGDRYNDMADELATKARLAATRRTRGRNVESSLDDHTRPDPDRVGNRVREGVPGAHRKASKKKGQRRSRRRRRNLD